MIFCANCDTEAISITENGTPLCHTCSTAYIWGQVSPDVYVFSIENAIEWAKLSEIFAKALKEKGLYDELLNDQS